MPTSLKTHMNRGWVLAAQSWVEWHMLLIVLRLAMHQHGPASITDFQGNPTDLY